MSWEAWGTPHEGPPLIECTYCNGQGWIKKHDGDGGTEECDACHGDGEVKRPDYDFEDDVR